MQTKMEGAFGADFSAVRIHEGPRATRRSRAETSPGAAPATARSPARRWLVAGSFGLLHGLIAGALAEAGLPSAEIRLALLSFNIGIELGQLGFIACVVATTAALSRLSIAWPRPVTAAPAYAIGSRAIHWMLACIAGL